MKSTAPSRLARLIALCKRAKTASWKAGRKAATVKSFDRYRVLRNRYYNLLSALANEMESMLAN